MFIIYVYVSCMIKKTKHCCQYNPKMSSRTHTYKTSDAVGVVFILAVICTCKLKESRVSG